MKNMKRSLLLAVIMGCSIYGNAQNLVVTADKKGRLGYVDASGNEVIPCKYTEANPFEDGIAKVAKKNKYGFINAEGKVMGSIKYTLILPFENGLAKVVSGGSMKEGILKGGKWGFVDRKGEEVLKPEYDEISAFVDGFAFVKKGNLYGIINSKAEMVLEPKYPAVGSFDQYGYCWFAKSVKKDKGSGLITSGKYGIINREGKVIVEPKYEHVGYFYGVKNIKMKSGRWFDGMGATYYNEQSLQKPFSKLFNKNNVRDFLVSMAKSQEEIDETMEEYKTELVSIVDTCYFMYGNDRLEVGVIDVNGKECLPEKKYNTVYAPSYGMIKVAKKKRKSTIQGFYDIDTKKFREYDSELEISRYSLGLAKIEGKDKVYFVDTKGEKVSKDYVKASRFEDGKCVVKNSDNKWGAIDSKGHEVIPCSYENTYLYFIDGLLRVKQDGKWGALNQDGKMEVPFEYNDITLHGKGLISVQNEEEKWGLMDKSLNEIIPVSWDEIKTPQLDQSKLVWVKDGGLYYCFNTVSRALAFEGGYADAENFVDGMAAVKDHESYGVINDRGEVIVPCLMPDVKKLTYSIQYMKYLGKDKLDTTDVYRLYLYEDKDVNGYKIEDVIPADKWDY